MRAAAAFAAQELAPIRNFLQVTPEFCTGGQPRLEPFAKLKADGVKAVLNLRQPSEHRADDEKAAAEQAGATACRSRPRSRRRRRSASPARHTWRSSPADTSIDTDPADHTDRVPKLRSV